MLLLNGWGQSVNTLADILPQAVMLDYARLPSLADALGQIETQGKGHDTAIGWSLGGQLLIRAIAEKRFRPRKLICLAAPFQFVETVDRALGMKRDLYDKFYQNYQKNPARTLDKSQALIGKGDTKAGMLQTRYPTQQDLTIDWLYWLRVLDASCNGLDFSGFPPTLLVHGERDVVVAAAQSRYLHQLLPVSQLSLWPGCGHAPHWHEPLRLRELIEQFLHV